MLQIDDGQLQALQGIYDAKNNFHEFFTTDDISQAAASDIVLAQGLNIQMLEDLGNRWTKRWSSVNTPVRQEGVQSRVLLQW
jgi:hypothetical protein